MFEILTAPTRRPAILSAILAVALGIVSPAPAPARAAGADDGTFTYQDIFALEQVADPRFSPDGDKIVYVRRSPDIMTDRQRSNLWIIDRDGSNHRPLVSGEKNASSPRFSPDGTRLAYISTSEGSTQIYVRWMDTGQTARVTNLQRAPRSLSWAPDGRSLAFVMLVPESKKPMIKMPEKPKGAEWAKPSKEIDALVYRFDGRGYLEQGYSHVFVVPADGGTPRQVTKGEYNYGATPQWTPDGKSIIVSSNHAEDWRLNPRATEIYEVDVASGEAIALTDRDGPDGTPVLSPDGKRIAYLGNDDNGMSYLQNLLYVMDRDGGNPRALTANIDRSFSNPQWAEDGRSILVQYTDEGIIRVARVDLKGKMTTVVSDAGAMSLGRPYAAATYASDGGKGIVYTRGGTSAPADLTYSTLSGKRTRLTSLNDDLLGQKAMAQVEAIHFPSSHDGREISAWMVTPPDFDAARKYPLILEIHGGPYAAYGPHFSAEIQLMAAAGYVVVYGNPRGSTSYGADFANYIHQNYPSEDYNDLMDSVDAVIAKGFIDERNLFVTGGSGGGVLSSWIIGKTSRFAAAVVAKPVINWISGSLTTDIAVVFTKYWMPDMPWNIPEIYWKYSPLSLVGNVITPTMVLTGEADYRTPISESEQFYQALKLQKVDAVMVRIPDAGHGITARPSNLIRKVKYIVAWFGKYRTNGEDEPEDK